MSEERTYKIPHNFYDGNGKLVETKDLEFKTNITDSTVFIRMDVLVDCHSKLPHNHHTASAKFDKANFGGRCIVLENEKFGYVGDKVVEITGYDMDCSGTTAQVTFHRADKTGDIHIAVPVWDHPFIGK